MRGFKVGASVVAEAAEAGFAGADYGLGTVCDPELGEDVGDMVADGFGAKVEAGGDVAVAPAFGDELQDLAFAGGQFGEGFGDVWL